MRYSHITLYQRKRHLYQRLILSRAKVVYHSFQLLFHPMERKYMANLALFDHRFLDRIEKILHTYLQNKREPFVLTFFLLGSQEQIYN